MKDKREKRYRRHKRIRGKVFGTALRPRLCIFRSVKHIYVQLIDDEIGKSLISAKDQEIKNLTQGVKSKNKETKRKGKVLVAYKLGELIAKKALEEKIERVVFDRGGYKYHGRVKALAEGARKGGLKF